jgi:cytoplasmic iron level regulating protein YaaA (DUF328/UPF0246 family)
MAYLITCSGSKKKPTNTNQGKLEDLFRHDCLGIHRVNLIREYKEHLDWSKTLPAYELYCGSHSKIYKKISPNNWHKSGADILILSALFGWIRHTDLIPYYDLKMGEKKGEMEVSTYLFWRKSNVLPGLINSNDIDLLSENYKKAFNSNGEISAVIPQGFRYSDRGDCVGYWLENELDQLK